MPDDTICRRLVIHGLVQGVGYRWSMVREAEHIGGLCGWVRNRRDGTVEALVIGAPAHVDRLIKWAQRGPGGGHVARVDIEPGTPEPGGRFEQRPTA